MNKVSFTIPGALLALMLACTPSAVWAFDFTGWNGLLTKHAGSTTLAGVRLMGVDYPALKQDPAFGQLVAGLKSFNPAALKTQKEKLAFWINVYNIMAVKMVLDHYPLDSIKDAGGLFSPVWKKTVGVVGGKETTLNEIEHEILRKMGDPRIHAAIVCASVSCPDLRHEAFTAERLEAQLDDQLKKFLANPAKGLQIDRATKRIRLSKIFDWFEEDFESKGGVLKFISRYAPEKDREWLSKGEGSVSYLDYNWDLNRNK